MSLFETTGRTPAEANDYVHVGNGPVNGVTFKSPMPELPDEPITGVPSIPLDTTPDLPNDHDMLVYVYESLQKVRALVDSITPEQIEKVQKIQSDPFAMKLLNRFTK